MTGSVALVLIIKMEALAGEMGGFESRLMKHPGEMIRKKLKPF